jgi:hypothetical protein
MVGPRRVPAPAPRAMPTGDVSRYHIRLETAHTILVRACVLLRLNNFFIQHDWLGLRFLFELRIGNRQFPLVYLVIKVERRRRCRCTCLAGGLLGVVGIAADILLMAPPPPGSGGSRHLRRTRYSSPERHAPYRRPLL